MEKNRNRMRRLLAFLIDSMISYIPVLPFHFGLQLPFSGKISTLILTVIAISFFVTLFLRDYLFNGRSIGKRLFKLRVVDADTLTTPSSKQLIVKNLFLFLSFFDWPVLIASGRSLGERATCTVVLHETVIPCSDPVQRETSVKKRISVAVTAILCISIFMFLTVSSALEAVKQQEDYQIAYSYLINSNAYSEMQADESQINLTGHSSSARIDSNCDTVSGAVSFSFLVRGQQYQVVCHQNGDMWYVCSDCTHFQ